MVVPTTEARPGRVVTFTANPSVDRTVRLPGPLQRGQVLRADTITEQAAGKGVNVARVVAAAGVTAVAVTAAEDAAYRALLADLGGAAPADGAAGTARVPEVRGVPLTKGARVRVNTTLTEPDGTTTKINEPGPLLDGGHLDRVRALLLAQARGADWVAMAGSLPPGAPTDWYVDLARAVRAQGSRVAVDTSDAALEAVVASLPAVPVDLMKPNAEELAQLTGTDPARLEAAAGAGDLEEVVAAGRSLQGRGVANVLVTLGGAGALLVTPQDAWFAPAPTTRVRSTVGAGDSSVAGFLLAHVRGADPAEQLASAVRHGSAAAALPGTTLPTPQDLPAADIDVRPVRSGH